jgi:hypothetical protein
MEYKRQYLSREERWIVSVWNKGKKVGKKKRQTRDGSKPAWSIFRDGKKIDTVEKINFKERGMKQLDRLNLDIGILDVS